MTREFFPVGVQENLRRNQTYSIHFRLLRLFRFPHVVKDDSDLVTVLFLYGLHDRLHLPAGNAADRTQLHERDQGCSAQCRGRGLPRRHCLILAKGRTGRNEHKQSEGIPELREGFHSLDSYGILSRVVVALFVRW